MKIPPDHLVPISWLVKYSVTDVEIDSWVANGLATKIATHDGVVFISFSANSHPIKFKDVHKWILDTREKCATVSNVEPVAT